MKNQKIYKKLTIWSSWIFVLFILFPGIKSAINPGLKNFSDIGWTCYINSTIQCLSNLENLNNFLEQNKNDLTGTLLGQYYDIVQDMKKAKGVYAGHKRFCEKLKENPIFENSSDSSGVVQVLFDEIPHQLKNKILDLAFAQEKRIYKIGDVNNPQQIKIFKYIYKKDGDSVSPPCLRYWSSNTGNFLAYSEIVNENEVGYDFKQFANLSFVDCIKEVCSKTINLNLNKIHSKLEIINQYKQITDLPQDEQNFFLSLPDSTKVSLERKLIPPEILLFNSDSLQLSDLKHSILIEKKYLDAGFSTDINYELKAFTFGLFTQYNTGHEIAYVKNKPDEWIQYDDEMLKIIKGFPIDTDLKSLKYQTNEPCDIITVFYELDTNSNKALEEYKIRKNLNNLRTSLLSLKSKLETLKSKLEILNKKLAR